MKAVWICDSSSKKKYLLYEAYRFMVENGTEAPLESIRVSIYDDVGNPNQYGSPGPSSAMSHLHMISRVF